MENRRSPFKDVRTAELYGVDPELLSNKTKFGRAAKKVLNDLDLHVVGKARIHKFPSRENLDHPSGLSYFAILSESHFAAHTYPEIDGYMDIDINTCSADVDLDPLADVLIKRFKPERLEVIRGPHFSDRYKKDLDKYYFYQRTGTPLYVPSRVWVWDKEKNK